MTWTALARAKVNLTLEVLGRTSDGYHELRSVFAGVDLADRLEVAPSAAPGTADPSGDRLSVRGDIDCPTADNLVLRAASALRRHLGRPLPRLEFTLWKRIPVAAGLGGGSSDAAAALTLALAAWQEEMPPEDLLGLARTLGSDVPFFLAGSMFAVGEGRGERLSPLPASSAPLAILLVTIPERLSTARVFQALDASQEWPADTGEPDASWNGPTDWLAAQLRSGLPPAAWAAAAARLRHANDLWPAAASLLPSLAPAREAMEERLERPCLLSGSGPTLAALYAGREEAAEAAAQLMRRPPAVLRGAAVHAIVAIDPRSHATGADHDSPAGDHA